MDILYRFFWYLEKTFEGCQKTAIFSFQCQFSRSKINFTFLKYIFLPEYWIRTTTSIRHCWSNSFLNMVYLVKMCQIFDGSQSKSLTRHQKILLGCSFECKNVLNFIWLNMKFYNCHTNEQLTYVWSTGAVCIRRIS